MISYKLSMIVHPMYIERTPIRITFKRSIVDDSMVLEERDRGKKSSENLRTMSSRQGLYGTQQILPQEMTCLQ